MYSLDELRSAFALLDYRADHGHQVPDILAELGMDVQDVMHVAEQRGMRAALIATGDMDKLAEAIETGQAVPIRLDPEQRKLMAIIAAGHMEAVTATLLMVQKADDDTPA